jgi:hypothetical protein
MATYNHPPFPLGGARGTRDRGQDMDLEASTGEECAALMSPETRIVPNRTQAPSSLQNIRLSSDAVNSLWPSVLVR